MAFEVYSGDQPLSPEHTTLEQYNVYRLGAAVVLNTAFSETIDERLAITVFAVDDLDADGANEVLRTLAYNDGEVLPLSGSTVSKLDGTLLGYVTSSVAVAETVSASVVTVPAHYAITLATGSTQLATGSVVMRRVNGFGNISHVSAIGGRSWVFSLRSSDSAQKTLMQTAMFNIMVTTIATALAELGVSKTTPEIQAAVMTLAGQGITIDSIIVDELETLEKGRRNGTIPNTALGISGTPPTIL